MKRGFEIVSKYTEQALNLHTVPLLMQQDMILKHRRILFCLQSETGFLEGSLVSSSQQASYGR